MNRKPEGTLLLFAAAGIISTFFLDFAEAKPNRILSGLKLGSFKFLGIYAGILVLVFAVVIVSSVLRDGKIRHMISGMAASAGIAVLLLSVGPMAGLAIPAGTSPRITISSGIYITLLCLYIILGTSMRRLKGHRTLKLVLAAVAALPALFAVASGSYSDLSIMKEYQVKKSQFAGNLETHLFLSFGSTLAAAVIAMPFGYLAYKKPTLEGKIMTPMAFFETIPTLSLFGILMVPLGYLGTIGIFKAIGVSGIGWAPAFIALTLYGLLPIARNTLAGFKNVDAGVVEAAEGMGMGKGRVLWRIELPLAFPVIFAGIRVALVQAIGGAVLAGLVGGGGLGSFVFLGLAEASSDLVLLGVIPIVLMTLTGDSLMKAAVKRLEIGGAV
ncbi:ABC transporter permease [Youngiibacter multivorans]|uniref:Osmoprotectant transport system permease protein n=1 Tax=Youngiibacter multivorans TaxID=937251 RepID=A0ABS4FZM2_9CLOT|nr:ABC transporter permease [Youngiibacter multivorans]MBP1917744.1 osmoprotectant transport system permease protein [Youngiibacter multivorans]